MGVAIVGYGRAARTWQVPQYLARGVRVVGAFDVSAEATSAFARAHPGLRAYASIDAVLDDPSVRVVDLATPPPGRLDLLERILDAGKHVLVQKPVSNDLARVAAIVDAAHEVGLRVAVNVNGRWAPAWRRATALVRAGAVGTIQSITHVFDTRLSWEPDPVVLGTDHFLLFDYTTHWVDITSHWVGGAPVVAVQARDQAAPVQPAGERLETMWLAIDFVGGPNALIRGAAAGVARTGHPFWIHGTEGTIRGDVDCQAGDRVALDRDGIAIAFDLEGAWFPDAFGETMLELLWAIADEREPSNSLRDHLNTLAIVCAACESADRGGAPVASKLGV